MNSETKATHTPGPWELMHAEHGQHVEVVVNGGHIAVVFSGSFRDGSTGEANANLIAAAPDLIEACEKALNLIDGAGVLLASMSAERSRAVEALRAAVAKAEGGQS
jgi:hypothetical protein